MLDEIKRILKELAMPRFNGDLGWDEDRIALLNRAWNEVEKSEGQVDDFLEKEQDHEYLG